VKGDVIEVYLATGGGQIHSEKVRASKAGRTVRQRGSGKWLVVEEMTRTGKPVGGALKVLASAVLMVAEHLTEPELPKRGKKASPFVQETLALEVVV
jgi:hypothetical protein